MERIDQEQHDDERGAEQAEREAWGGHPLGVTQRITITRSVYRSITVMFDEPVAIEARPRGRGTPPRTGVVTGFEYHDNREADVDPSDIRWDGMRYLSSFSFTAIGHLFKKDGTPMSNPGYAFTGPAKQVVLDWCEANPDWWKVRSDG